MPQTNMKYLPWLLLLIGIYFPSSSAGNPSDALLYAHFAFSCTLVGWVAYKYGISENSFMGVFLVTVVLIAFTLLFGIHNMPRIGMGNLPVFVALPFVFSLDPPKTRVGLTFASLLNLVLGTFLVTGFEPLTSFFISHYNDFYADLLPTMLALHKPVLTFASHSIAGFFLYLFFWANWRDFRLRGSYLSLFCALGHVALCIALTSHTSLAMAALAIAEIAWTSASLHPRITATAAVLLALAVWAFTPRDVRDAVSDGWQTAQTFWLDTNNETRSGFWGRFSRNGNMRDAMVYVSDHPFSPIGVSGHPDMMLGDSGILQDFVRGSAPLVLLIYGGLWYFLRRCLNLRTSVRFLFVVLLFEVGYSVLIYQRTLCLLPLFVSWMRTEENSASGASLRP
ncbi:MAG: hypothetical protein ACRD3P_18250 [Terriglobales bacterium]